MNRRQHLVRLGSGLGLVTLAGCLDTLSSDGTDVTVTDRTGERELDRAIGRLNTVAIALHANDELETEETDPAAVEFESEPHRETIASARTALDTAADELDSDRDADVAVSRAYADGLEALVAVTATVTDDGISADIETVTDVLAGGNGDGNSNGNGNGNGSDNDQLDDENGTDDHETARTTIDDRTAVIDGARIELDDALATFDDLDAERFAALPTIDRDRIESGASTLDAVLDAQTALAAGYSDLLDGHAELEGGREASDDGSHEDAETAFTDAKSSFDAAQETFTDGRDDSPQGLTSSFETALCQSTNLNAAAADFAEAAAAAADGNLVDARRSRDSAEESLEAVEDCSDDR